MSELDVFETRFAAAYRRYLDEVPTEVDAAAVVRTVAAAHPRPHVVTWPSTLRPAPALAWLVLLALLLAALGAAVLFVGSQRPVLGFACPPGSMPNKPGPVDQARPAGASMMAFDRQAGRIVALGTADGVETWTFDVCSNTWTQMHPNREPSSLIWGQLIYDVDSDVTIAIDRQGTWAYDLAANTWTKKSVAPSATPWAYDPVSGLVVGQLDNGELWSYDVEIDTWSQIHQVNGPGRGVLAYDASVDRIVAYAYDATWVFDIRTGTWSRSGADTPPVASGMAWPNIVYDEAAERTVVFGNGRLATYDATADRWEVLIEFDPGRLEELPLCMVYDPVNRRLVGCGYPEDAVVHQADVIQAFDVATRHWTLLLGPGE